MKLSKDHIKFLIFLITVIILTPFLMDIISRSWNTELMDSASETIRSIDPNGISILINVATGLYVGSIILLFVDRYKRIQAILLSIGIFLMFGYMSKSFGIDWNIIYLGIGIAIGIVLGSNLKIGGIDVDIKEFRRAANNVSIFSIAYAILSFLILYASPDQDNSNFMKDAFTILAFTYFFAKLMNYEGKGPKIFVLGPANAGKTMFLAGCYLRALNITEIPARPSRALLQLIRQLHQRDIPWPERTGGIVEYQFTYETGALFPRKTTMRTIDYPGVFLDNLSEYMYTEKDVKKMDDVEKRYLMASQEIMNADSLIFIIDGAKYPRFEDMGITNYIEIIDKLHGNGKKVKPYIIITKSDLFMEEHGNREDYEGFKKFIEKKFSQNIFLKNLLVEASNATFYPVFYYTRRVEEEYVPMRDENGNVYTFGFDKFMDSLSEY